MTKAIINTDMNIGPFRIPGNGQNMILNNYELFTTFLRNGRFI